jgi:L-fucose isomerase-like protein
MKIAVFFIGRKRPGFEPAWGTYLEKEIRTQLQDSPFESYFFGPITNEKEMASAIIDCYKTDVETIIISQPTMGDGNLWSILPAEWCGGIVVWATPENPKNSKVSACGLVAAHNWTSGMAQAGMPPYLVYGMPGDRTTAAALNNAICGSAAAARLRQSRVGLIGDHAPGFINMAVDAAAMLQLLGTRLRRFGLHEFFNLARSYSDFVVAADRKKAEALGLPVRSGVTISDDAWNMSSRIYLAVRELVESENLDAVALRCWPEIPNELGIWPYLAVPRLASDGINICEEGDVDGALGCLLAKALGCETAAFNSDWLEHDDGSIVLWHGGATPFGMCQPIGGQSGPTLNVHYNSGKPLTIDSELLYNMDVTLFRFWRMGNRYSLAIAEGKVEKPPRYIEGCAGTVRISDGGVNKFFLDVCNLGMPHHVVVMKGHYGTQLRAFAERFRPGPMDVVREIGFR